MQSLLWLQVSSGHFFNELILNFKFPLDIDALIQMFPAFFMSYVIAMLEQLKDKMQDLKSEKAVANLSTAKSAKLRKCIEFHLKIIEVTNRIEKIYKKFFLVRILMSILVFCTTAFSLTFINDIGGFIRTLSYIALVFGMTFIPCYYANEIALRSMEISTALFHSDWICEDKTYRDSVKIIMERSKNPIKLHAIGSFDIDLETFMRICNSAYSLYAVFNRVNGKN
jgi:7tm Odorant receptor